VSTRVEPRGIWAVLGVLGALVAVNVPMLGSDPWPFSATGIRAHGLLGPLVRVADRHWDLGVIRTPAMLGGLLVALAALVAARGRPWRAGWLAALAAVVVALLVVPATLLQVGLREASEPWLYDNDSTYQIELAGAVVRGGGSPYGHDYGSSGLERFYPAAHVVSDRRQVALSHFAYFPGTPLTSAAWGVLPSPLDDYRLLVVLATLGLFAVALLFRAPFEWRIAAGAVLAANPLAVRAAWFGTADAVSLLWVVLSFALVTRSRFVGAAAALAAAVLLKQFALAAVPFVAVMIPAAGAARRDLQRAAAVFAVIVVAGFLPFLVGDAGALWRDTVAYGGATYRIIGYGLPALLLRAGAIKDRFSAYPFVPIALVTWLPATAWLVWYQRRVQALWLGAAGFAVSAFVLFFVSRVFQNSYLVWPLAGAVVAALLASAETRPSASASTSGGSPAHGEPSPSGR
jgi:hypothetical protein